MIYGNWAMGFNGRAFGVEFYYGNGDFDIHYKDIDAFKDALKVMPKPGPSGKCAVLYSDCDYTGDWTEICDNEPVLDHDVRSIFMPDGWTLVLHDEKYYFG